ncbi:cysteine hydrolase family protein [Flagellimonas pacifica]|uniref:Nicotinamidase-related amidase n=1 Tax=Flagellimonas pacifica TaxID=1247520 RepID=A0A285MCA0_9FLAO|nr:cysteine hydrolase family protein [Allomuricauda parva]SNY94718.1 Nicotinamidase-related amidase [Allomuricauda parva]
MLTLLLIDIQVGLRETNFYGTERNNLDAEVNAAKILEFFRTKKLPVFHIQHCSTNVESPLHPSKPGNALHPLVSPLKDEPVFQKNVNSAFIGTPLETELKSKGIEEVVIVGLTTEHCVSTSTRMAANLGFKVNLISDATAAFDKIGVNGQKFSAELIHNTALANLKDEFAIIKDTVTLLNELQD